MLTYAGFITGFPGDTAETILRDVEIIKKELPIDVLEFFYLTPLPGSEDHQKMFRAGAWMDPDLNKYDLYHITAEHPKMSREEWAYAYNEAWKRYYSFDHCETILRRAGALRSVRQHAVRGHLVQGLHRDRGRAPGRGRPLAHQGPPQPPPDPADGAGVEVLSASTSPRSW